jgi:anti-sigma regulatory factor (Ser/Thr protein kinase)
MESVQLPPDRRSPTQARAFTRRLLGSWNIAQEIIEDAELLVTEVVTNAVIHANTWIDVAIDRGAHELRFAVSDHGKGGVEMRVPSARSATGRGLYLVDRVASEWRAEQDGEGTTTVRFTLPLVVDEKARDSAGTG